MTLASAPVSFREDPKQAAVAQWSADPCGPVVEGAAPGTRPYFEELMRGRWKYAPWMGQALGYDGTAGLDVLDVGCGQGIDLARYVSAGASVTGIDLTPGHVQLAREHMAAMGLAATVVAGDAESLPFSDRSFDRVSSNGVLHHTPNLPAALREIRRVLRPGGEMRITLYNRSSFHYWLNQVLLYGIVCGDLARERSMAGVLSRRVEQTSIGARPLVRVHSPRQARRLVGEAGFAGVRSSVHHFRVQDAFVTSFLAPWGDRLAELGAFDRIGRLGGWYVLVRGLRPTGAAGAHGL
jgi:SAM-dependent methyltransferase